MSVLLENASAAVEALHETLAEFDGLVLEEDEREALAELLPVLARLHEVHPRHAGVQAACARAYRKLSRQDEARTCAERAVALERTFDTLTALATVHRVDGRVDEAVALFDEVAARDPGDTTSLSEGGDVLRFVGRHDEAARRYEEALRRDPEHAWATIMLALVRFRMTGDQAFARAIVHAARHEAVGVDWVEEVADEVAPDWRN